MRIAIVEDDTSQRQLLAAWLGAAGHRCHGFADAGRFRAAARRDSHDLVILDWNLPDGSGLELIRWLRNELGRDVPVLFATVREDERDLVEALDAGADDYLKKPLRERETLARVSALARRAQARPSDDVLEAAPFAFDLAHARASRHGEPISLTHREFQLALFLFRSPGRLLSRGHILESVWGRPGDLTTRTVDTHISRLRSKLGLGGEHGWRLVSVYQLGYRLEVPDRDEPPG